MSAVTLSFTAARGTDMTQSGQPVLSAAAGHPSGIDVRVQAHTAQQPQWDVFAPSKALSPRSTYFGKQHNAPTDAAATDGHIQDRCCTNTGLTVLRNGFQNLLATAGLYSAHLLLKRGKPPKPGKLWLA